MTAGFDDSGHPVPTVAPVYPDDQELGPDYGLAAEVLVRLAVFLADAGTPCELALRGALIAHAVGRPEARTQRQVARLAGCSVGLVNRRRRRLIADLAEIAAWREQARP